MIPDNAATDKGVPYTPPHIGQALSVVCGGMSKVMMLAALRAATRVGFYRCTCYMRGLISLPHAAADVGLLDGMVDGMVPD